MTPRHCLDCRQPIGKWMRRCAACSRARRSALQRHQPNRSRACPDCGTVRISRRARCPKCRGKAERTMAPCPRCGREFWPWANGKHPRKTCGCKAVPKPSYVPRPLVVLRCAWCDAEFASKVGTKFCSVACRKKATSARKHLRRRGLRRGQVHISAAFLAKRDGAVCALCGGLVDMTLRSPNKMSATVDHIVPISSGGQHVESNAQLAHYGCNSRKGPGRSKAA